MKFAFFPGCVSRGACPELYTSTVKISEILGIELDEKALESASCTGAGVLQEKNQLLLLPGLTNRQDYFLDQEYNHLNYFCFQKGSTTYTLVIINVTGSLLYYSGGSKLR